MNSLRPHGWSLIAAVMGLMVALSLHPSEHGLFDPAQVDAVGRRMIMVHSIALLILPLWFFGAIGIARRFTPGNRWGMAGLVAHGFAMVAMMNALVIDGLVTPGLAREIVRAKPAAAVAWKVAFNHNVLLDAAFMNVGIVALALAVIVWSLGILWSGGFSRLLAIGGLLLGLATLVLQLTGLLNLQPHIFMLVLFGQIVWYLAAGISILRQELNAGEVPVR